MESRINCTDNSEGPAPAIKSEGVDHIFGHSKETQTHSDIQNLMDTVIAEVIIKLKKFTNMVKLR